MNKNKAFLRQKRSNISTISIVLLGFIGSSSNTTTYAGKLDTCFNSAGIVPGSLKTYFSESPVVYDVATQSDGKIIVAGQLSDKLLLMRYNRGGGLDATFNKTGIVINSIGSFAVAHALALQQDGKIIVAGLSGYSSMVARYNSDGSLDTAFNGTGIGEIIPIIMPQSIAITKDNKIIVAGLVVAEGSNYFGIIRYNANGSLDSTLSPQAGKPGVLMSVIGKYSAGASSVAVQQDGKFIVAGVADGTYTLVRYNTDGSFDTTFNGAGIVKSNINALESIVRIQNDGKIVVAVSSLDPAQFTVVRYKTDGSLDKTFNRKGTTPGMVTTQLAGSVATKSLMLQNNGKIVVAGFASDKPEQFALSRFNADGALDTSFNSSGTQPGIATMHIEGAVCKAAALGWDGKIVLAGDSDQGQEHFIGVSRYNADQA